LPRATQPRFSEGSGQSSVRDDRNTALIWKKTKSNVNQDNQYGQQIQRIRREIQGLRRVRAGGFIPATPAAATFHPFSIYHPTTYPATGVIFDQNGVQSVININANVPTNFASNPPTVNPSTDAWRIWNVRSGLVEFKLLYTLNSGFPRQSVGTNGLIYLGGSPSFPILNTDYICPNISALPFDSTNQTNGIQHGGKTIVIHGDIDNSNGASGMGYAIWVQINPDTPSVITPTATIIGRRFLTSGISLNTSWTGQMFPVTVPTAPPSSVNNDIGYGFVIPVGVVINQAFGSVFSGAYPTLAALCVDQILFDHCLNRYPVKSDLTQSGGVLGISNSASGIMNFRGGWPGNSDPLHARVSYYGDVFSFSSHLYFCIQTHIPIANETPVSNASYWQLLI